VVLAIDERCATAVYVTVPDAFSLDLGIQVE
jgi:hypothetical protein